MSETQKHTKPNVPNLSDKREQKESEIPSAERETNVGRNVPNLRFPGFEGEWERKRIGDIGEFFSGGTPSSSRKDYYGGDIPFIRSGEIHSDKTELFLTQAGYKNSSAKMVEMGDLLLALYGANSGDISISQMYGAINQAILCIRTNVAPVFFKSAWEKHAQKILNTYLQGGQGNLSADIVKKITLYIPTRPEQTKIAALFSLLDERITIQNKVIERYKSLIKALCHNLIISSNGTVCHIGDILKIGSGKDYKHLTAGSIPVFGTGGYMLSVSDWLYDGESVCIGRKGTINNPFYVDGKFWTVDTLFYTYDFEGILPKYCYYLFQTIDWLQYNEASGVPSLSKSTIERIQISIPSIDEQAKAIQILDRVEMAITCWRELLNHDESIKQYLLSQLFI